MTFLSTIYNLPIVLQFGSGFRPPTDAYTEGVEANPFGQVVLFLSNLIGFLTILGAIFFVVQFILGALNWITAGGDSGKLEGARNKIMNGIIGLAIVVGAYAIVALISSIFDIDLINLQGTLDSITPNVE